MGIWSRAGGGLIFFHVEVGFDVFQVVTREFSHVSLLVRLVSEPWRFSRYLHRGRNGRSPSARGRGGSFQAEIPLRTRPGDP